MSSTSGRKHYKIIHEAHKKQKPVGKSLLDSNWGTDRMFTRLQNLTYSCLPNSVKIYSVSNESFIMENNEIKVWKTMK